MQYDKLNVGLLQYTEKALFKLETPSEPTSSQEENRKCWGCREKVQMVLSGIVNMYWVFSCVYLNRTSFHSSSVLSRLKFVQSGTKIDSHLLFKYILNHPVKMSLNVKSCVVRSVLLIGQKKHADNILGNTISAVESTKESCCLFPRMLQLRTLCL